MLKIVFMGTPEFSVPILDALYNTYEVVGVVTQPDKLVGRKKELQMSPVKKYALEKGLKVIQPIKIREDYEDILALNPDLIVTAAYGQIVGMKLLNAPRFKSINVHGSLLPKHRGGAPIQRAIMNGDKVTGITIMYMAKKMDAGDILAQKELEILDNDTSTTLFNKMSLLGRDLLMETIPLLIDGKITPIKQNDEEATFSYNIESTEEEIDFEKEAIVIERTLRALLDEPGMYFYFNGFNDPNDRIKVYDLKVGTISHNLNPGEIVSVSKKYFTMACGNNTTIDIYEVQPVGKKRMKAVDFINGGLKKYRKE